MSKERHSGGDQSELCSLHNLARLIFEAGHLKATPRAGWFLAGVKTPESVAEHTQRTTLIGVVLASLSPDDVDAGRVALMCTIHDLAETRIGDIPSVGRRYLGKPDEGNILRDQLDGVPSGVDHTLTSAWEEYEARSTPEAVLARDADKIECLAQAMEYQSQGHPEAKEWIHGSFESIRSEVGRTLATVLMESDPTSWWRTFVEEYRSGIK